MRLRQLNPENYGSSRTISSEFESIIRYLNSAEVGNKTVSELLRSIFDETGSFSGPVEFRFDTTEGLQYRIGTYSDPTVGWTTILTYDQIRGSSGVNFGDVGHPFIASRAEFTADSGQSEFDYAHTEDDDLLVFVNGILKVEGGGNDYTSDTEGGSTNSGSITFNSPLTLNDVVTIAKVQRSVVSGFRRSDWDVAVPTSVFPFETAENQEVMVYLNGVLQKEGGGNDYVIDDANDIITFTSPVQANDRVSVFTIDNASSVRVAGLMVESDYVNLKNGLIKFDKVEVNNGAILPEKVHGLPSLISRTRTVFVSDTTPASHVAGDIWLNTSQTPNEVSFSDGAKFLPFSPEGSLPPYVASDANKVVMVNGTGTGLIYGNVDLSSKLNVTERGAANGVAPLDATGRLPTQHLPLATVTSSLYTKVDTVADQDYEFQRIFGQQIEINRLSLFTSSGTCTVQLTVDTVPVGTTYAVTSVPSEITLGTPIAVNALSSARMLGFVVTSNSAAANLEVTVGYSGVSS